MKRKVRLPLGKPQMEVYTVGHGRGYIYSALPSKVTTLYSLLMAGSVSGLAYFLGDRFDPSPPGRGGYFWFVAAMGTMTAIGLIATFFRARRIRKTQKQSEGFEEAMKEAAGGFGDADDPAEMQRLDDLRANFQKGIDTFREYGKDLYSLPWYVIVGEPGSGKTEAIRHSELKFPETLQDRLQGTGGTYSMHWWFTNHAVILDTAGAMLMNPEAGERFQEFLKLLKGWRPECPINGMLLTIPVDSLLVDDIATAEEKARTISGQLAIIQQSLDIRFPIYLMITKADRLPGFREFADAAGQEHFDRQMVGWSNPHGLDDPFHAGRIDDALQELAGRLRARRLALLNDPVPRNPSARRLDEVDALYTFPDTIVSLAPRLKRYLEIIFQTGEWAKRPPFFRGLYFTSAMREGSTLDEELASALGMPVDQLPQGGVWSEQKSLYLRDLFMEKIFRERGLVTRLRDIAGSLRRRLAWLYGTVGFLLLLLLGGAFLVRQGILRDLNDDQRYWNAANEGWDNGRFLPVLERTKATERGIPRWEWAGNLQTRRGDSTRLQLLERVEQKSRQGLAWGWVFRPLSRFREMERDRRFAYQTLFEGAVVKPLLDAARETLTVSAAVGGAGGGQADAKSAQALAALVELEAVLSDPNAAPFDEAEFAGIFRPLLDLTCTGDAATLNAEFETLLALARRTYGAEFPFPSRRWMREEQYVSGLNRAPGSLPPSQRPIAAGWELFAGSAEVVTQDAGKLKALTSQLYDHARRFREAEDALAAMARGKERQFMRVDNALTDMRAAASAIASLEQERGGMKVRLPESLYNEVKARIARAIERGRSASPLLAQLAGKLNTATAPGGAGDDATDEERALHTDFLAGGVAGARLASYERELLFEDKLPPFQPGNLRTYVEKLEELASRPAGQTGGTEGGSSSEGAYTGPRKEIRDAAAQVLRAFAPQFALRTVCGEYRSRAIPILDRSLRFPLVRGNDPMTSSEFLEACNRLQPIRADRDFFMAEGNAARFPESPEKSDLQQLFGRMGNVVRIMDALYNPEKKALGKMKVQLDASSRARDPQTRIGIRQQPEEGGFPGFPRRDRAPELVEERAPLDQDVTRVDLQSGISPRGPLRNLHSGPPAASGTVIDGELDVNQGFRLNVLGNYGNETDQSYLPGRRPEERLEEWGILRWLYDRNRIVHSENQTITVRLAGALPPRDFSFTVTFASPLPASGDWPLRRDFLEGEPAEPPAPRRPAPPR